MVLSRMVAYLIAAVKKRGQPAEFPVAGVIAGWVEALQLMTVGSKWKLTIPHHLAYGDPRCRLHPTFLYAGI